jgi:hypothetical protein
MTLAGSILGRIVLAGVNGRYTGGTTGRLTLCADTALLNCATAAGNLFARAAGWLKGRGMPLVPGAFLDAEFISLLVFSAYAHL